MTSSLNMNFFHLSEVPSSSSTPLLGHVRNNKSEKSEIPFDILKPLVTDSQVKPVTNTEGNEGYFGDEKKNMSLKVDEEEKKIIRSNWTPTEDDKLKKLVEEFGPYNWNNIAKHFHGRTGKSCRLRWRNQLNPKLNKSSFSEEEEFKLLVAQKIYGNKWATICKLFRGRTDNAVKNHFHIMMSKRKKEARNKIPTFVARKSINSSIDVSSFFARPLFNYQAYASQILGLLGDRKVEAEDFGYDNIFSSMKGSFNYSDLNSKPSESKSVTTIRHNVSILGQSENVTDKIKVPFIDFLGVGDT